VALIEFDAFDVPDHSSGGEKATPTVHIAPALRKQLERQPRPALASPGRD